MLKDPIHFFDDAGVSALKREALEADNARLAAENARLTRLVEAMQRKLQAVADVSERVTH